jgi:hypothetical protein
MYILSTTKDLKVLRREMKLAKIQKGEIKKDETKVKPKR